jgi:VanZ family protein
MTRLAIAYAALLATLFALVDSGHLSWIAIYVNGVPLADKVAHFFMFGMLALLANAAMLHDGRLSPARAIVLGSIVVAIAATMEETTNAFVSCRNWSLADLAANYLGIACLGILPLVWWAFAQPVPSAVNTVDGAG